MKVLYRISAILLIFMMLPAPAPTQAQDADPLPGRDMVAEQEILDRLGALDPSSVPLFEQATEDMDAGNLEKALEGYEAVLARVPGFPDALRRLASVELEMGLQPQGRSHAERAYELDPSGPNAAVFGLALLLDPNSREYAPTAFRLATQAVEEDPEDPLANHVLMYSAGEVNNINALRSAAETLVRVVPEHAGAHFYLGLLEAMDENWLAADEQLELARAYGYPSDEVASVMNEAGIKMHVAQIRATRIGLTAIAVWLGGMGILFLLGFVLSNLTLVAANPDRPNIRMEPGRGEKAFRALYRVVITLTSLYFYVSIPFLVLIVIGAAGGIMYLFFELGRIPTRFVLWLGIAVVYTLFAILRSLFTRLHDDDPGRRLTEDESPALWDLTGKVAEKLGTRPIQSIFITPGTEIAVLERGGMWKKLTGKGHRTLILGLGVLPGLSLGPFKAILAHEYGHFRGKDTAGGNLAHLVQASIRQLAYGLAVSGQARWYNPAWLFINGFYRVFLRVTHGASRLQEILADRYAALAYGTQNMVAGLTHVIRAGTVFNAKVNREVEGALKQQRVISNIYELPDPAGEEVEETIEQKVQESINRETSTYDTHPSPAVRFRLIENLESRYAPALEDTRPSLELFPNLAQLREEMTGRIRNNVAASILQAKAQAAANARK